LHVAVITEREAPAACAHYCRFAAAANVQLYRADEVLHSIPLSLSPSLAYDVLKIGMPYKVQICWTLMQDTSN